MPTTQREQCESGIYHLIHRGTGQMDIFEDDRDRSTLAELLAAATGENNVRIVAWCFMSNHVHLLVQGDMESISAAMRLSCSQYVRIFNMRHGRIGAMFQGRFSSIPVKSDAQFLTVLRYIHRNPVAAGLCKDCREYRWSSYGQYLTDSPFSTKGCTPIGIPHVDTALVLSMFSDERDFERFHASQDGSLACDIRACGLCSEDESREIASEVLGGISVSSIVKLPRHERNEHLHRLKKAGFGIRLIQRLTGVNYSAIRNA